MSLTVHERMKVTEEWIKHCQPVNITVMVQIGGASLRDVQEMVIYFKIKADCTFKTEFLRPDMQK